MREVVVEVPRADVEAVLDRLLPRLPGGVRERERDDVVELRIRGDPLPSLEEIVALTGRRDLRAWEHRISDDWRERRVTDYIPDVIAGRLVVRPEWAPATGSEIELVLADGPAFGLGSHPTTRRCLELLLGLASEGSFADLGCGTGVLAILAARLGFNPVYALDLSPESVESAQRNATANGVRVEARVLDLMREPPPASDVFAANVPPGVHRRLAEQLADPFPATGVLSGFHPGEALSVLEAYTARGAEVSLQEEVHGWSVAVLNGPLSRRSD